MNYRYSFSLWIPPSHAPYLEVFVSKDSAEYTMICSAVSAKLRLVYSCLNTSNYLYECLVMMSWTAWLDSLLFLPLIYYYFFFSFFCFSPFFSVVHQPSSLVLSFVTVFNCITFLYMLFSLTEWTVSLFMHHPSMFLGILSTRCSSVWLVKMSFPVRYCCCFIYEVLLLWRDGQYRIMHYN